MIEQHVAERWIVETLGASAALTALVGSRICSGMAPEGRTAPFVLVQFTPGGWGDLNTGMARRDVTGFVYLVEGIDDAETFEGVHGIAAEIDAALHDQTEGVDYGTEEAPDAWTVDCIRLRPHTLAVYDKPRQVRQSGGFYAVYVRPA